MDVQWYSNNAHVTRLAVVVAGYPDTSDVFLTNVVHVLVHRGFNVVGLTLPGYRRGRELSGEARASVGLCFKWSLTSLVDLFESTMLALVEGRANANASSKTAPLSVRPTLVCHDWGSILAFEFLAKYPLFFDRIVCLDVSGHTAGDKRHQTATNVASWIGGWSSASSLKKTFWIAFYQIWIMWAYLVRWIPLVGDLSVLFLCWLVHRPQYRSTSGLHVRAYADMGYPYFHLWFGLLTRLPPLRTMRFGLVPVTVPLLYLYGENKPFQFHTDEWLAHVSEKRRKDGISDAAGIAGGGHWFFAQGGHPQDVALRRIDEFLVQQPRH